MARILVLHAGRDDASAALADRVAAGARSIRFAEATVRRLSANERADGHAAKHRPLDPSETLTSEDAVVLVAASADDVDALACALVGAAPDLVLGVATTGAADAWTALAAASPSDAVLLPPTPDPEALGARAATVAGWVRHVRSHGESGGHGGAHAHGQHHH